MKRWLCMLLAVLLIMPAAAETVQDQALALIQEAGIAADSVTRIGNEIIIPLSGGGTASLRSEGDFDPLALGWRFADAADSDVALYLDHALSMLLTMEMKIPADLQNLTGVEKRLADNAAAIVSGGLTDLESTGEQGLRILLEKLAAHDDSGLNSLRARLASRLLGKLDITPVDPALGCAWYDALVLPEELYGSPGDLMQPQ